MTSSGWRSPLAQCAILALGLLLLSFLVDAALAQPFGGTRGAPPPEVGGFAGWILAKQAEFYRMLSGLIRAAKADGSAAYTLLGVSFLYGIFHAAGPGHGKAVLASYMVANEVQLKRGLLLAALAALLQGLVAIALVAVAALVFNATAGQMTGAAQAIEVASYIAIALLGARLVWTKGRSLAAALRARAAGASGRFVCEAIDDPTHVHGPSCGHAHAPDPATLAGPGFQWRDALATVVAAGLRPCSGAILVLVFTLSQNMLAAGAGAVMAMSAGTAITTGAIAAVAVLAKDLALRLSGPGGRGPALFARGAEFLAALLVLGLGLALLLGFGLSLGAA